ncbi:hypothetical protein E2C01_097906 [Portunus trituberculatus]|uniref:Uncharacterized protein n=1 Tax=Portunus trituberculatus TaxID=210409 RepID=A0A5B7KBG8_PORTR|nr:hypothetical protein [Portunus trituberculatus]
MAGAASCYTATAILVRSVTLLSPDLEQPVIPPASQGRRPTQPAVYDPPLPGLDPDIVTPPRSFSLLYLRRPTS